MPTHARTRKAFFLALTAALSIGALIVPVAVAAPAFALDADFTPAPPTAHGAEVVSQAAAAPAPFPYAETFKLHSYPGAQRVIYLDFNGETVTNTAWNNDYGATIDARAFDTDGNPGVFSNVEQDIIQSAWQRVAEDFAPMAVDVTTEDPGLAAIDRTNEADQVYGTRALITSMSTIYDTCGCSGVSYVGAFNISGVHQTYQPAFVLSKALGANDKDFGDVISHEVGHSLGLSHDGNASSGYYFGQGAWAPLMGAGFYHPVTQFSKGDYSEANNTEDDFAVMGQHGATVRTDDYGDTTAAAAPLSESLSAKGIIATDADVDMFSFAAASGSVSFTASPTMRGPNLDTKLELLDANGVVVASADPPAAMPSSSNYDSVTGLDASVTASVAAGTYYVRVQGVGSGDPTTTGFSGYGSVGNYTISGASVPASVPNLSVSDATVDEGNSGTATVNFTLSLSAASASPVSVSAATADGTGLAGSDYTATSGTVTIPAGQTNATFSVLAAGDLTPEAHDKFSLNLSQPSGANLIDGTAIGTLRNDDGVGITISDVSKSEGAAGYNTTFTFTVTLSKIPTSSIGVTLNTVAGTALSGGSDFYAKNNQVLTFAAGQKSKTFSVAVKGDGVKEATEKFYVNLSNPTGDGAKLVDAQGVATIVNDD